jgi:O-antigen/teichoic acid export membrane protein
MDIMFKLSRRAANLDKNRLFKNSVWGVIAQFSQTIFTTLFLVIIARSYNTEVFAGFIISTVLYQLITAFSSLGLNQWFIREVSGTTDKVDLINKFIKIQIYSSAIFYLINVLLGFVMYDDSLIQILTIILGINIVCDNLLNAIKCLNISEFAQKKSFVIFSLEALLKLAVTCVLFLVPLSIVTLSATLVIIRLVTLNLFLKMGSSSLVNFRSLKRYKVSLRYLKGLLVSNWAFIIIGSVSIINWRIAAIIISKTLSSLDIANYEISYRLFSVGTMLPIVVSASIFPVFTKYFKDGELKDFRTYYSNLHFIYVFYGLIAFTFIYSFADILIPIVFGANYTSAGSSTRQMFLTMLVFPTAFLQANVLVALKLEKLDMWLNVASLFIYLTFCLIGLYFVKSLITVNISIFIGFLSFRILQDILLISKKISTMKQIGQFYILNILVISGYTLLTEYFNPQFVFIIFWTFLILIVAKYYPKVIRPQRGLLRNPTN